jgi:preprotein translocase SecE subunit
MNLSVYKRGQGKYTRMISAGAGAGLMAIGCLQLYRTLDAADFGLWIATMVPVGTFLVASAAVMWIVNRPNVADFMIAAEGEMKKVNWSSKQEVAVSTFIVIMVVVILAVLLGTADYILQLFIFWLLL